MVVPLAVILFAAVAPAMVTVPERPAFCVPAQVEAVEFNSPAASAR